MIFRNTRFLTFMLLAVFVMVPLAACETVEGAGRDIEHAGETVQDAAN